MTDTAPNPDVTYGTISYHPNLNVNQVVRNNGTTDTTGLDSSYLPRPAAVGAGGAYASWSSGTYTYDGAANVKAIGSSSFVYDNLSRINSATVFTGQTGGGTSFQKSFSYDVYGNLLSGPGPGSISVNSATNRLNAPSTYDAAGNMTGWNAGPTYQYDSFNQMTRMTNGTQDWLYLYNASDERVLARDLNALVSRWSLRDLSGLTLREYLDDNGKWSVGNDYLYRDGLLLAAETQIGRRHFHLDHLGSPRLITRASGYQSAYHAYFPFGMEATGETQDSVRMKFTGHERDLANLASSADDLDYMHARAYNPAIGRFLGPDPMGGFLIWPQALNRFSYAAGNPLRYIDPDGRLILPSEAFLRFMDAITRNASISGQVNAGIRRVGGTASFELLPRFGHAKASLGYGIGIGASLTANVATDPVDKPQFVFSMSGGEGWGARIKMTQSFNGDRQWLVGVGAGIGWGANITMPVGEGDLATFSYYDQQGNRIGWDAAWYPGGPGHDRDFISIVGNPHLRTLTPADQNIHDLYLGGRICIERICL